MLDDGSLQPEALDRYLRSSRYTDDSWQDRLPTQEELGSFRYVAISRAFDVVRPNITGAVATGGEQVRSRIGMATSMTVEGELGHASLDITVVNLATKAVVCRGQLSSAS